VILAALATSLLPRTPNWRSSENSPSRTLVNKGEKEGQSYDVVPAGVE
jgi:hypothetical protein